MNKEALGPISMPNMGSNTGRNIALGLGGGAIAGLGLLAKQKMQAKATEQGMENFYKNHPQQMQQPMQKMGCAEVLKLAEENDKESAEKLAQLSQILDTEFVYKDEFVKWAQEKMEEVDEKLEKIAIDWSGAGKTVGNTALKGLGIAGAGAASMIGGALISDMYSSARSALTKSHNFNKMVQADPSLAEYPAEKVKAYFTTLHEKGGPEISGDPLMASAFVKQQLDFHGSNILDQVSKVIGMRSTLAKAEALPKLDFGSLLSKGPSQGMSPPTKPGSSFNQEQAPGGYFGG